MKTGLLFEPLFGRSDVRIHDPEQPPFRIHGVFREGTIFRRMPVEVARKISTGVHFHSRHCAGGRVRFVTDSPYVILRTKMLYGSIYPGAYDLYTTCEGQTRFLGVFQFSQTHSGVHEAILELPAGVQTITINMPSFAEVCQLHIGLQDGCLLEQAPDYCHSLPIVFYGSSITHGSCSSRSGTSYTSMVARKLDADYINLGFGGSALGEVAMAEYIAGLNMSVFVLDYDHNSSVHELSVNHGRMFDIVRAAHPKLPILMMSRPKFHLNEEEVERCSIVRATYERARAAGDENVYFLSGPELMALIREEGIADTCHPNDIGFFSMSVAVSKVLEEIFAKAEGR